MAILQNFTPLYPLTATTRIIVIARVIVSIQLAVCKGRYWQGGIGRAVLVGRFVLKPPKELLCGALRTTRPQSGPFTELELAYRPLQLFLIPLYPSLFSHYSSLISPNRHHSVRSKPTAWTLATVSRLSRFAPSVNPIPLARTYLADFVPLKHHHVVINADDHRLTGGIDAPVRLWIALQKILLLEHIFTESILSVIAAGASVDKR